jgi:GDP-mannose 4,6-dehydratase
MNIKKKALITGVTGMVGSHLLDFLIKNTNWDIYGILRWRSSLNNISGHINSINSGKRIKLLYADIRDTLAVQDVIKNSKPDFVFHLAAQSYPQTSFSSPLDTMETNIQGTARILDALKNYCPRAIIHICSSSEIFGKVPKNKLPINEDCTFHPASPYAISKVGTDLLARHYAEAYKMCVMSTRMFTHTGPRRGDVFAESSFAKQIALIEAELISPIVYVGNLESLRTIADVRDAVRAYFLLVTKKPIAGAYYNIGGNYSCKIKDILSALLKKSKKKNIRIVVDKNRLRPLDADLQIPSTKKFENHTGWKPEISFDKTMTDLLNYWRDEVLNSGSKFLIR